MTTRRVRFLTIVAALGAACSTKSEPAQNTKAGSAAVPTTGSAAAAATGSAATPAAGSAAAPVAGSAAAPTKGSAAAETSVFRPDLAWWTKGGKERCDASTVAATWPKCAYLAVQATVDPTTIDPGDGHLAGATVWSKAAPNKKLAQDLTFAVDGYGGYVPGKELMDLSKLAGPYELQLDSHYMQNSHVETFTFDRGDEKARVVPGSYQVHSD